LFRLEEHIDRLIGSARIYRMEIPFTRDVLINACRQTVAVNGVKHCYLRPIALRSGEEMGVLGTSAPVEVFIIPKIWGQYLGADAHEAGVDVVVSSWRRPAASTFPAMAKAGGNYLNAQLAKMQAVADGYAEAIMLDVHGQIAEGSGENLFLVIDGALHTAPAASSILMGITRDSVMKLAGDLGLVVHEQILPREMLYLADEIFFTGTAAEITPVRSVDRMAVGTGQAGSVTRALQEAFSDIVTGTCEDRHQWLTY
jgi:branched-chain amino acid aminotransferase